MNHPNPHYAVVNFGDAEAARQLGPEYEVIAAAIRGDVATLARLLDQGAIPLPDSDFGYSWSPLHYAADRGQLDAVRLLVERGANVNRREKDDFTPITVAAASKRWEVVRWLADQGADIHHTDATGKSALSLARRHRRRELVEHLEAIP